MTDPATFRPDREDGPGTMNPRWYPGLVSRPMHTRPSLGRGARVVAGVAAAMAVVVVSVLIYLVSASRETKPADGVQCARYEVAPNDLWLRDEFSTPQVQLPHGEQITVTSTKNPHGLALWEVRTGSGAVGWVDHRYLKPVC